MLESLHVWELPYIAAFQKAFHTPLFDLFFRTITLFDDKRVVATLVILVWIWAGWRWGAASALILLTSWMANTGLKNFLAEPRPYLLNPSLSTVVVNNPYGLPSGAAQTGFILAALFIYAHRSAWGWLAGIAFALSLSLSRIYIGVHFFSDLIGGWIVGGAVFSLFFLLLKIPAFAPLKRK